MQTHTSSLVKCIEEVLDDYKALDVQVLGVKEFTSVTDYMVIATGTSSQHIRTLANKVAESVKEAGFDLVGSEGQQFAEWVLLDFGDAVVHLMLQEVRDYYALEKLWSVEDASCASA